MTGHGLIGPDQRRRACVAVLAAVFLAVVLVATTADGPDAISGSLGGDYPSFHAAGELAREDLSLAADEFYDPEVQAEAQHPYLPPDADGQLFFAYPAFFVLPYMGISAVGFTAGYLLNTALMVVALGLSLLLLRPCSRIVRVYPLETFTLCLTFYPLFRGLTGGQNTGLTLLLTALVWRVLHDRRDAVAGLAVGLLLFKPPFALPFLGVFAVARRWRALGAAGITAVALFFVGALLTDLAWPSAWIDALRFLDEFDTPFNVQNFVSVPGFAEAVFGIDSTAALIVGYSLAAAIASLVAALWWRASKDADPDVGPLVVATALAGVLVSPHALYYDAGLVILAGLVLLEHSTTWKPVVTLGWIAGLFHLAADPLGADPLVFLVLGSGVLVFREAWRSQERLASVT